MVHLLFFFSCWFCLGSFFFSFWPIWTNTCAAQQFPRFSLRADSLDQSSSTSSSSSLRRRLSFTLNSDSDSPLPMTMPMPIPLIGASVDDAHERTETQANCNSWWKYQTYACVFVCVSVWQRASVSGWLAVSVSVLFWDGNASGIDKGGQHQHIST